MASRVRRGGPAFSELGTSPAPSDARPTKRVWDDTPQGSWCPESLARGRVWRRDCPSLGVRGSSHHQAVSWGMSVPHVLNGPGTVFPRQVGVGGFHPGTTSFSGSPPRPPGRPSHAAAHARPALSTAAAACPPDPESEGNLRPVSHRLLLTHIPRPLIVSIQHCFFCHPVTYHLPAVGPSGLCPWGPWLRRRCSGSDTSGFEAPTGE